MPPATNGRVFGLNDVKAVAPAGYRRIGSKQSDPTRIEREAYGL